MSEVVLGTLVLRPKQIEWKTQLDAMMMNQSEEDKSCSFRIGRRMGFTSFLAVWLADAMIRHPSLTVHLNDAFMSNRDSEWQQMVGTIKDAHPDASEDSELNTVLFTNKSKLVMNSDQLGDLTVAVDHSSLRSDASECAGDVTVTCRIRNLAVV